MMQLVLYAPMPANGTLNVFHDVFRFGAKGRNVVTRLHRLLASFHYRPFRDLLRNSTVFQSVPFFQNRGRQHFSRKDIGRSDFFSTVVFVFYCAALGSIV